ncbi:TrmH family RNA methyltransferase [Candidatus Gracilibacteria bacterium]|nr:TrmH family RNA methyltransferase [Candidatus Gracilibacteria bacterium]
MIFLLDNIRSKFNIGSFFRTADAFNLEKLILCGFTPYPPDKEISKTAIGAENSVKWQYFQNSFEAVQILKNQGKKIISVELDEKSKKIGEINFSGDEVFVFGNEINGVDKKILEISDEILEIPMLGKVKESMNVGVVAGIVGAFGLYFRK